MVRIITQKTKGKAKERPNDMQPARIIKGRELVPLVVGSYLTHSLSHVACMQIERSNSLEGLKQVFLTNVIFSFIVEAKAH
jgi:hypothetical protein